MSMPSSTWSLADLQEIIVRHWGYRTLRPVQGRSLAIFLLRRLQTDLRAVNL
jgi:hypothetical protein